MRYSLAHAKALRDMERIILLLHRLGVMKQGERRQAILRLWGKGLSYYHESYL